LRIESDSLESDSPKSIADPIEGIETDGDVKILEGAAHDSHDAAAARGRNALPSALAARAPLW